MNGDGWACDDVRSPSYRRTFYTSRVNSTDALDLGFRSDDVGRRPESRQRRNSEVPHPATTLENLVPTPENADYAAVIQNRRCSRRSGHPARAEIPRFFGEPYSRRRSASSYHSPHPANHSRSHKLHGSVGKLYPRHQWTTHPIPTPNTPHSTTPLRNQGKSETKSYFPYFDGDHDIEEYPEWEQGLESYFDYINIPQEKQVKFVVRKLEGRTAIWWNLMAGARRLEGRDEVQTWSKIKRLMRSQFLSSDNEHVFLPTCTPSLKNFKTSSPHVVNLRKEYLVDSSTKSDYIVANIPFGCLGVPMKNTVGILGDTQHLPRLVGLSKALKMVLLSKSIIGEGGKEYGIVDAITSPENLLIVARRWALEIAVRSKPWISSLKRTDKFTSLSKAREILHLSRQHAKMIAPNMPKNQVILDAIEEGLVFGGDAGLLKETRLVREIIQTPTARSLVHAFCAERSTSKLPNVTDVGLKSSHLRKVAVIGGGLMSSGIATPLILNGVHAILKEIDSTLLQSGINDNEKEYFIEGQFFALKKVEMDHHSGFDKPSFHGQKKLKIVGTTSSSITIENAMYLVNLLGDEGWVLEIMLNKSLTPLSWQKWTFDPGGSVAYKLSQYVGSQ